VRLDGRFQALKLRSVPRQKPPYRPIDQVVAEQNVYELADVTGTLVGSGYRITWPRSAVPAITFTSLTRSDAGAVIYWTCVVKT